MAPKRGNKRAAEAVTEDNAKKLQTVLKKQGVTKATHEAILEAIQHPMASSLTPATRTMLIAMLPQGLFVPGAEREEAQQVCVRMLGEVFESITSKMQAEISEADGQLSKEKAEGAKLSEDSKAAETALKEATEEAASKKMTLADAAKEVISSKANLVEKEKEQQAGSAAYEEAVAEKEELAAVLAHDFRLLRDGDSEATSEVRAKILTLSAKLSLEESLMTALPSVLAKKPTERGSFDAMVVAQLEEGLTNKVAKLSEVVTNGAPAAAARQVSVDEAKQAMETAKNAQQLAADELTAANNLQKKRAQEGEDVKAALDAQGPVVHTAGELKREKEEQLQGFMDWNFACFETLRDRETLAPKKAARDSAADELAAAQAEMAQAAAMEAAEAGA